MTLANYHKDAIGAWVYFLWNLTAEHFTILPFTMFLLLRLKHAFTFRIYVYVTS